MRMNGDRYGYQIIIKKYQVRTLDRNDVDIIYDMSRKNEIYYQYHPPFVTKESIIADMKALPPGKSCGDKYYIGFLRAIRWSPIWI